MGAAKRQNRGQKSSVLCIRMVDYSYFCSNTRARLNREKTVRVWDSWNAGVPPPVFGYDEARCRYDISVSSKKDNPVPYNNLKSICPSASWWTALAGERTKGRSAARMLIRILIQRRKRNQETTARLLLTLIGSFHPWCTLTHTGFYVSASTKIKTWYWTIHVKISKESWIDMYAQLKVHY